MNKRKLSQFLDKETASHITQLGASWSYKNESTWQWKIEINLCGAKEEELAKSNKAHKKVKVIETALEIHAYKSRNKRRSVGK